MFHNHPNKTNVLTIVNVNGHNVIKLVSTHPNNLEALLAAQEDINNAQTTKIKANYWLLDEHGVLTALFT